MPARVAAGPISASLIRNQTDAQAGELFESVALEHINARQHLRVRGLITGGPRAVRVQTRNAGEEFSRGLR